MSKKIDKEFLIMIKNNLINGLSVRAIVEKINKLSKGSIIIKNEYIQQLKSIQNHKN